MRAVVKARRAGTVADLEGRGDLMLLTDSQEIKAVKEYFGSRPAVRDFDGFFVEVADGDYGDVYGFEGIVPYNYKPVYLVTLTYQNGTLGSGTKKRKTKKSSSRGGSSGLMTLR